MSILLKFKTPNREQRQRVADGLAVALAVSLPWSTSATSICATLLLLAILSMLDFSGLKKVVLTPAGGLPVILVTLGAVGMLWAGIPWAERFNGISSFLKLLLIPLIFFQFSRSDRAATVLIGFLISCVLLLIASWVLLAWPSMPWPTYISTRGIPVKDYLSQSAMFTICIFIIVQYAYDAWKHDRRGPALALLVLALVFLANVFYIATSRTSLVVVPILLMIFGLRLFGWKGAVGLIAGFIVLIALAWPSASYLRLRIDSFFTEVRSFNSDGPPTSAGERITFWTKSVGFIKSSPIVGHGTGSIHDQFERSTIGRTGMAAEAAENPHNQILAVGIQLGFVGIAALLAFWLTHLLLFTSGGFTAWVGLVVVIQNIVGSFFNSHLFDFTHGWVYVVGVGVAGGVMLKERADSRRGALHV